MILENGISRRSSGPEFNMTRNKESRSNTLSDAANPTIINTGQKISSLNHLISNCEKERKSEYLDC